MPSLHEWDGLELSIIVIVSAAAEFLHTVNHGSAVTLFQLLMWFSFHLFNSKTVVFIYYICRVCMTVNDVKHYNRKHSLATVRHLRIPC